MRAPGADEELPGIEERIVAPEGRFEVIDGQLIECSPAHEAHATAHSNLGFVVRGHARASFSVATDMLTRVNRFSDIAPDISVFPTARDPVTGGRQLEHIAIEVRDTQPLSDVVRKARLLITRGVRRVFCVDVADNRVLEWNPSQDDWVELSNASLITDKQCFVRGLPVGALLESVLAENAVASALLSKKNPVLQAVVEQSREEGVEMALRQSIEDLCELLAIKLSTTQRAQLDGASREELDALRLTLKSTRRWPA